MRSSFVVAGLALAAACDDAITLEIAGDRPIPRALDRICIGVADTRESGGHKGQQYDLVGDLSSLPQTLRIDPGTASSAYLWVRGDRAGVPVARAIVRTDFGGDARLVLDRCQAGRGGVPTPQGEPVGPPDARLVVSHGSGNLVVAFAPDAATIIDASGSRATATPGPPLAGRVLAAIPVDVDGDCDDDLIVATDAASPIVWRREHRGFTLGATLESPVMAALAAADIDHDGDMDLVTGAGGTLMLWYNDGAGRFSHDPDDLRAAGRVSAIRALALGDINADGNADLLVGQARQPMTAWLGGPSGAFEENDGVLPASPLDVASFTLADVDGDPDLDLDLAVAVVGAPMRLYIDREGLLEDQTFDRLPRPAPIVDAIAIGSWDDGKCEPDAVLAARAGSLSLHGEPGKLTPEAVALEAATDVVMVDLDDDGDLDAVLATPQGVRWLAR